MQLKLLRQGSFLLGVIGVLLPWLEVAGRTRNGLGAAELLASLGGLTGISGLRTLSVFWYLGAALGLVGWALATLRLEFSARWLPRVLLFGALVAWIVFAVGSALDDRIRLQVWGPTVGLIGVAGLFAAESIEPSRSR